MKKLLFWKKLILFSLVYQSLKLNSMPEDKPTDVPEDKPTQNPNINDKQNPENNQENI